jgi:hypothetical protein
MSNVFPPMNVPADKVIEAENQFHGKRPENRKKKKFSVLNLIIILKETKRTNEKRIGFMRDQRIPREVLLYFNVISFFVRSQRRSFFRLNSLLIRPIVDEPSYNLICAYSQVFGLGVTLQCNSVRAIITFTTGIKSIIELGSAQETACSLLSEVIS